MKILIFGNSGSGKSTLAKKLCDAEKLAYLDLDTIAWKPTAPPERRNLVDSAREIRDFIDAHERWVMEGCYADLLAIAAAQSTEMIYLDLPIAACIANAKNRPWEPHKYASKQAQDANLHMLIKWIAQYRDRTDEFSESAHRALYEKYSGKKTKLTEQH